LNSCSYVIKDKFRVRFEEKSVDFKENILFLNHGICINHVDSMQILRIASAKTQELALRLKHLCQNHTGHRDSQ
jgi:hypothetical protein